MNATTSRTRSQSTHRPSRRSLRSAFSPVLEGLEARALLSTYAVTNTCDAGPGSLRQAIIDADNHVNGVAPSMRDVISFDPSVFGSSPQTISLLSALPSLTDAVEMDGSMVNGLPGVQLDGSNAGAGADGLDVYGGNTTIKGMILSNFGGNGIVIAQLGGDVIQSNYIGTDASGTGFAGNANDGIAILAGGDADMIIGNVISANSRNGIDVLGSGGHVIKSNYIGVDATGSGWMGNGGNGILLSGATSVTIGGPHAGDANIVAANAGDGIQIANGSSMISIQGNDLGTDGAGDAGLGNGGNGVDIVGSSHEVTVSGNVISGNTASGVQLASGGSGIVVQANYIGTSPDGTLALPNLGDGVYVNGPGNALIANNVLSGNDGNGVDVALGGVATVRGNYIGLAADGASPLGNQAAGVYISGSGSTIGGPASGQGNAIAFNAENGVTVLVTGVNNSIRGNAIFSNTLLGIDLGNDGVTLNDSLGHVGPNNYQDFPAIASVVINNDGTVTFKGSITTQSAGNFLLDFYANTTLNASGYGEGEVYLGGASVTVSAAGTSTFSVTLTTSISPTQMMVTGTSTDAAGNTSEFSQGVKATPAPPVQQIATTCATLASSNLCALSGQSVTFTATVKNGNNPTGTVDFVEVLANGSTMLLGSASLDSHGMATFSTSSLSIGSHAVHAEYHGDANNTASNSAPLNEVVKTTKISISGHTYSDRTGNGLSADDTTLSGVNVKLYLDANANGKIDAGETLISTVTTGADGSYQFSNLTAGHYLVQEVTPTGYVRTAPALTDTYVINAPAGSVVTNDDFDNFKKCNCMSDVSNLTYIVTDPSGCTHTYTDLRGHTIQGDKVTVKFTVPTCHTVTLTLVSYTAPGSTFDATQASLQQVYQFATGTFGPGVHTMTVTIPKCYYQVDFVCGSMIDHFGPANSNVFYSAQGRLFSADNGGKDAQISVALATDTSVLNT